MKKMKRILAIMAGCSLLFGAALADTRAAGPTSGVPTWSGSGGSSTAYTFSNMAQCANFMAAIPPPVGGASNILVCSPIVTPNNCLSSFGPILRGRRPNRVTVGYWFFCFD